MTNGQIYVLISIASVILIGVWSIFIAVKLDKANKIIRELRKEVFNLRTPF